ncbi:hypothetical protein NL676_029586 [Syzygium grande]|nr:hypothetical protein NL676_029586 [Syzygium grande]
MDEESNGSGGISTAAAKGWVISQAVRKSLIQNTIPIFIELKRLLKSKNSPLTGSLMDCLCLLLKDYKNEIDDILVADKQLQRELLYDMQKHESAKARSEAAEAVAGMEKSGNNHTPLASIAPSGVSRQNKSSNKLQSNSRVASALADAAAEATAQSVLREVNRGTSTPPLSYLKVPKVRSCDGATGIGVLQAIVPENYYQQASKITIAIEDDARELVPLRSPACGSNSDLPLIIFMQTDPAARAGPPPLRISARHAGAAPSRHILPPPPPPPPPPPATATTTTLHTALTTASTPAQLKQVHAQILRRANLNHPSAAPLLLHLLLSSPSLGYALSVFRHVPGSSKTRVLNKFLRELSRGDRPRDALVVFDEMWREGVVLDRFSFPPLLKAGSKEAGLVEGSEIHGLVVKLGYGGDPFVQTALVRVYAAGGRIMDAHLLFDKMSQRDVVSWSIMIDGFCQNGLFDEAMSLFEEMRSSNVDPDKMILSSILSACARAGNLTYGKKIHEYIAENNVILDPHMQSALISMYASSGCMDLAQEFFDKMSPKNLVVSTAMISWYSKVGQIENARLIFDQLDEKDLVCWSAMISGYAESDQPQEALILFKETQVWGIKPDQITILSVVSACAHLGVLDQARWMHKYVDENGFGEALPVKNSLVDMYAKCGSLERARKVFEKISSKNVISWTTMINSFAMHGDANNALSHAGLVEKGRKSSHPLEALEVIETMPLAPNVVIWGSLMAACRVHGEDELGEFAAKQLLKLEPDHDGAHVVLSNIYAKHRRWQDVGELRQLMRQRGVFKERGWSRIELNNEVHQFAMADRDHNRADQIYVKLDEVVRELKLVGYAPSAHCVLVDVEDEDKREVVLWHSEKLAVCYGLLTQRTGSCIRIVKNLRICEDCHTFMKLISKEYRREIIVRDRTRFHHCKDGICSCRDYW